MDTVTAVSWKLLRCRHGCVQVAAKHALIANGLALVRHYGGLDDACLPVTSWGSLKLWSSTSTNTTASRALLTGTT